MSAAPPEKTSKRLDGVKLTAARIAAGYRSREAFAAAASMSYASIQGYELDKREPSWHAVLHLADLLGVPVDDLLTDEPRPVRRGRARPAVPAGPGIGRDPGGPAGT